MTKYATPAGYTDDYELPIRNIPNVPLWCENYWFVTYDPVKKLGVWIHLGRMAFDPTLWHEMTVVYLPDGDFLVSKGYGRHLAPNGLCPATLSCECVDPWNRWTTRFDGAAVRTTRAQLDTSFAPDGIHLPVKVDLDWTGFSPVWMLPQESLKEQSWGGLHYQQLCNVKGTVSHSGTVVEFNGTAIRDHTRGARDFFPVNNHACLNCAFPSGRGFITLDVTVNGQRLNKAAVIIDGKIHEATVAQHALLSSPTDTDKPYEFELAWDTGTAKIRAEMLHNMPYGMVAENEISLGYDPKVSYTPMYEGFSRFEWDGEIGYGLTERSVRVRDTR